MPSPRDDKGHLRRTWRRWRADLDDDDRRARVARALTHLRASAAWSRARTVALYVALPGEPDLTPLVEHAWATGRRVALPRVLRKAAPLAFFAHTPDAPLLPGPFRVPEPGPAAPRIADGEIDLVVVPALAVDPRGYRLGYGGGFYDRTLPRLTRAHRVFLGLEAQCGVAVPRDAHDVPVHAVVTPQGYRRVPLG
jgi:5-formyltetrahydrofolate cyclo-ligase